jgi:hypothetical protein
VSHETIYRSLFIQARDSYLKSRVFWLAGGAAIFRECPVLYPLSGMCVHCSSHAAAL